MSPAGFQMLTNTNLNGLMRDAELFRKVSAIMESPDLSKKLKLWLIENLDDSHSQVFQDLFALALTGYQKNGYFVEFGGASGTSGSNTYLLERDFGWRGIISEPAFTYRESLAESRKCEIDYRCVYSESGLDIEFLESKTSMLSTIAGFENSDSLGRDRKIKRRYKVKTVTLEDLLVEHNAPTHINYLSIDTEGSEFEILSVFDFKKFSFDFLSIEHNSNIQEQRIEKLLTENGYRRVLSQFSRFDSWYVPVGFRTDDYFV
jgi:FkbM family methyltransferase